MEAAMYVSRLTFATRPGHTHEVEEKLRRLRDLVAQAGGQRPRVLRTHYASLGAPDVVFEQEASDLATLEREIGAVTGTPQFQQLAREISDLLAGTPKREIYHVVE
jgi:quinol monooxygenase YgiN